MRNLNSSSTRQGARNAGFMPVSEDNCFCKLTAGAALLVPVPFGAAYAVFTFKDPFAVKLGENNSVVAVIPALTTQNPPGIDAWSPKQMEIKTRVKSSNNAFVATYLSVISPTAQDGFVEFFN